MAAPGLDKVHFFDLTSATPGNPHRSLFAIDANTYPRVGPNKSWSPNTLRTRLVLNFKRIPYTQTYLPFPAVAPVLRALRLPPLTNGPMPYTLPAILHAPSIPAAPTTHALNDSWPIALHLERAFPAPGYPSIFPTPASYPLAVAVQNIIINALYGGVSLHIPKVLNCLEPECAEYFDRVRSIRFSTPSLAALAAQGPELDRVWADLEKEFGLLAEMLRGVDGVDKKSGPFFEGDQPGYADLLLAAWFGWYYRMDRADFERLMDIEKNGEFRSLWEACRPWIEGQGENIDFPVPKGMDTDLEPVMFKS
ncbi:hypothetical protein LOZ53_005706 [Ophidiomyces ophidiicola]|nr:hypothetical protein LOZ55_006320 [Ophidiomyces ophidiicola]KAI1983803.1 hypothetical protein LOZ53_005706 [Ophidiomyces ophidiicola]KAI1986476.1 hypothetical protein LOZ51_006070 [Ophidiomyces ophidiicola]